MNGQMLDWTNVQTNERTNKQTILYCAAFNINYYWRNYWPGLQLSSVYFLLLQLDLEDSASLVTSVKLRNKNNDDDDNYSYSNRFTDIIASQKFAYKPSG